MKIKLIMALACLLVSLPGQAERIKISPISKGSGITS